MVAKRKRRVDTAMSADLGTPESQQQRDIEIAPRTQLETGMVVSFGARVVEECLLDKLHRAGQLRATWDRSPDTARSRYDEGIKLRELHHAATIAGASVTSSYGASTGGQGEMTDEQAALWDTWRSRITRMQGAGHVVSRVCCHDEMVPAQCLPTLWMGLERLVS